MCTDQALAKVTRDNQIVTLTALLAGPLFRDPYHKIKYTLIIELINTTLTGFRIAGSHLDVFFRPFVPAGSAMIGRAQRVKKALFSQGAGPGQMGASGLRQRLRSLFRGPQETAAALRGSGRRRGLWERAEVQGNQLQP